MIIGMPATAITKFIKHSTIFQNLFCTVSIYKMRLYSISTWRKNKKSNILYPATEKLNDMNFIAKNKNVTYLIT